MSANINAALEAIGKAKEEVDAPLETTEASNEEELDDETGTSVDDEDEEGEDNEEESEETEGESTAEPNGEDKEYTLSSLAEEIGVDDEFLYNVKIPMPDGQDPISIGEFKDNINEAHRIVETATKVQQDYHNSKAQLETQYNQLMSLPIEVTKASAKVDQIRDNYNKIDWDELRAKDENKYTSLRLDYNDAFAKAQEEAQTALGSYQHQMNEFNTKQRDVAIQQIAKMIPEWTKDDVYNNDTKQISSMMNEYGFTPDEINNLMDPRHVKIVYDLMKLKSEKSTAKATLKKVQRKPKMLKGGAIKTKAQVQDANKIAMMNKAKSGNKQDRINAALGIIGARRK